MEHAHKFNITPQISKRAQQRRGGRKANTYLIEGQYLTIDDLATRLQISRGAAKDRLYRAQKMDGTVTLDLLSRLGVNR